MGILSELVSSELNLRMQGIETSEAITFRDVLLAILDNRTRYPGNPNAEKWADRHSPSIALPLRSAIAQQVRLTLGEEELIRRESIEGLTQFKLAQAAKERAEREKNQTPGTQIQTAGEEEEKTEEVTLTDKEIEDWMSIRVATAVRKKVEAVTFELLGDMSLIGFQDEEALERLIRQRVFQETQTATTQNREVEVV